MLGKHAFFFVSFRINWGPPVSRSSFSMGVYKNPVKLTSELTRKVK